MTESRAPAFRYSYGPVPSRRLGKSLGVNNIPAKVCTYNCVYCQLGRTPLLAAERQAFFDPAAVVRDVSERVAEAQKASEKIDYLALVPDGEPTLDLNLGRLIAGLKTIGFPVAVITNGSLLGEEEVRNNLAEADWVSLKIDSPREASFRKINRPRVRTLLEDILDGMIEFSRIFKGELAAESMLLGGVNDDDEHLRELAAFLGELRPAVAYLSVPHRPPAEKNVSKPSEDACSRAYRFISEKTGRAECLLGYEGNGFASTGDVEEDILAITSVHPLREDAVDELLAKAGRPRETVRDLVARGDLAEIVYEKHRYYLRKFTEPKPGA